MMAQRYLRSDEFTPFIAGLLARSSVCIFVFLPEPQGQGSWC